MAELKENIIAKGFDLLKYTIPILNQLPRHQKFTLGDRIQNLESNLLDHLVAAFYSTGPAKRRHVENANITLEQLRLYIRLGYELDYFPHTQYKEFARRTTELGRMIGGWLKKLPRAN